LPGCAPGMYRLAVRLREENERLIAAVRAYCE
jgi:histidinol-phosphate/aromatic aminotransferase/cobyric acid decarboxylase-like protein